MNSELTLRALWINYYLLVRNNLLQSTYTPWRILLPQRSHQQTDVTTRIPQESHSTAFVCYTVWWRVATPTPKCCGFYWIICKHTHNVFFSGLRMRIRKMHIPRINVFIYWLIPVIAIHISHTSSPPPLGNVRCSLEIKALKSTLYTLPRMRVIVLHGLDFVYNGHLSVRRNKCPRFCIYFKCNVVVPSVTPTKCLQHSNRCVVELGNDLLRY